MTLYAGLDVGDKATHLCVVNGEGGIVWRGACATDPETLVLILEKHAPGLARVVLETGTLSARALAPVRIQPGRGSVARACSSLRRCSIRRRRWLRTAPPSAAHPAAAAHAAAHPSAHATAALAAALPPPP